MNKDRVATFISMLDEDELHAAMDGLIDRLRRDRGVATVILYIDGHTGVRMASEHLEHMVEEAKEKLVGQLFNFRRYG